LSVDFLDPFRASALPTEWSKFTVKWTAAVPVIRFNEAHDFETITFEPGDDGESALRDESEANYF
jgi:hypothetical protein